MAVRIEGVSDVLRMFDKAPDELLKDCKKAIRKACTAEARNLKKAVPEARDMVKSSVKARKSGDITGVFGMFLDNKVQGNDGRVGEKWFHQYWKNYGTLQGRDPSHRFDQPIKHGSTAAARQRRNSVGEMHQNFYENAIIGFEERAFATFKQSLKDQGYDIE